MKKKRDKREPIIVFEHYDVAGWWYLEFRGAISRGLRKDGALDVASLISREFDLRILVRRTPGNA